MTKTNDKLRREIERELEEQSFRIMHDLPLRPQRRAVIPQHEKVRLNEVKR